MAAAECLYYWDQPNTVVPFHMTHEDNIVAILEQGLFSHHTAPTITDISNPSVNALRSRVEPIYGRPIHHYVPFYMNPRNAFMYANLEQLDSCIILKMETDILQYHPGIIFTIGNAARNDASFFEDLPTALPDAIFAKSWYGCDNTKSKMMSEILIPDYVPAEYINTLIFRDNRTLNRVYHTIKHIPVDKNTSIDLICDKDLFF